MNRTLIGVLILALVAGGAALHTNFDLSSLTRERKDPIAISIFYGGEKSASLRNPDVRDILATRHKITLNTTRAGSVEIVTTLPSAGRDCF